jgi:hypothetical protein
MTQGANFDPATRGALEGTKMVSITMNKYMITMPFSTARPEPSALSVQAREAFFKRIFNNQPVRLHMERVVIKIAIKHINWSANSSKDGMYGFKKPVIRGCKRRPKRMPIMTPVREAISIRNPLNSPLTMRKTMIIMIIISRRFIASAFIRAERISSR